MCGQGEARGFIQFASVEEAKYILDTLNGNIPLGWQRPLSMKYVGDKVGLGAADGPEQGDWQCPLCNNVNFRRREVCNMCGQPRPEHLAPPISNGKGATMAPAIRMRTELPPNLQLYINGLPVGSTEESLKMFFIQYGDVYQSKVLPLGPGKSTVAGFVRMPEFEGKWCIENLDGFQPEGYPGPLTVTYARDKTVEGKGEKGGFMGKGPKGDDFKGLKGFDAKGDFAWKGEEKGKGKGEKGDWSWGWDWSDPWMLKGMMKGKGKRPVGPY